MTNRNARRGFTLIELLVVVLIIGILATVALPQYQKAVQKTRMVEAVGVMKSLANAVEVWYLENGEHELGSESYKDLLASKELSLDFTNSSRNWTYSVSWEKSSSESYSVVMASGGDVQLTLEYYISSNNETLRPVGKWLWRCGYYNTAARQTCELFSQLTGGAEIFEG